MKSYSRKHLANSTLTHSLHAHVRGETSNTAEVLADIAEFDERKLYAEAGYSSMFAYCLGELPYCEQATYKRIRAARTAQRFPAILELVADGRLHLTAVVLLTPHLNPENCDELLAAATRKSKAQIELLLAERFPQPDLAAMVRALPTARPTGEPASLELSPGTVEPPTQGSRARASETQLSPGTVQSSGPRPKVTPLAPRRFALQLTMDQETHDLLREAQDLLSHQVPSRDVADVLRHVLQTALPQLRKQKFAATSKPRRSPIHASVRSNTRHVPAAIRRAVWERDAGRCTYVSANGHRCEERGSVEFDHIDPVARGGLATLSNLRLLCRAHNQYAAERVYGPELMSRSRHS